MSSERCRRSYADDPTLERRVFELLDTWFVGIEERRRETARIGGSWAHCSTPFVVEADGRIVSHAGLLEMPFVVEGERLTMGGVHGVCTLESERRRGHFRRIMEELLEFCEGRYETLELGTENPEYYEPFGFRVVPEHRFHARVEPVAGGGGFRPFDLARPGELERLDRLLAERAPVSRRIGVVDEHEVFKFSEGIDDLHYCEALDCFAVYEREGAVLALYDVVAREIPPLEPLLGQIGGGIERVVLHFTPDRFDVATEPERFRWDGDHYMVRGPFPLEGEHFMVPRSARH
jgi:predicted N-acetyltransferase YhbS